MGVPELPLDKEQISAGTLVGEITVRMPEQLHAGAVLESRLGEDPCDAAVEPRPLVGPAPVVEHERQRQVPRRGSRGKTPGSDFFHESADELAQFAGNED